MKDLRDLEDLAIHDVRPIRDKLIPELRKGRQGNGADADVLGDQPLCVTRLKLS